MAKFKKVAVLVFAVLMLLSICAMSAGCSDSDKIKELQQQIDKLEEENNGLSEKIHDLEIDLRVLASKFYSLQEAYNLRLLSTEDLQTIAGYHHNNVIKYPESLGADITISVKRAWAKYLTEIKEDSKIFTGEDIAIMQYYGTYSGCVIVIVDRIDVEYADVYSPYTVEIGNVTFNYNYPRPEIVVYKY